MSTRVLLVLGRNLGWRTYASTLIDALGRRPEIDVQLVRGGQAAGGAGGGQATSPRHREATRLVRDLRIGRRLRRTMKHFRPHVVHAAGHLMARPTLWPGGLGADARLSVLLDGTARQSDAAKGAGPGVGRLSWHHERRILARADLVNCVSQWAASSVIDDYGVEPSAVRVRPYPIADIDRALLDRAAARRDDESDRPVQLLFVGGDFERKGGPWLLDTFAARWSDQAVLRVVSDTAPTGAVPSGVTIHRNVDNQAVREVFFPAADVLVHPTRFDQSSMVAIEAAAFSLPAVVTAVGGVGEVVDHERTGVVAQDHCGFATAVDRLIADRDLRRSMGEAARDRFLAVHEADGAVGRMVDDWMALVPS